MPLNVLGLSKLPAPVHPQDVISSLAPDGMQCMSMIKCCRVASAVVANQWHLLFAAAAAARPLLVMKNLFQVATLEETVVISHCCFENLDYFPHSIWL